MTDFFAMQPARQLDLLESAGCRALSNWGIEGATLELIKYRENAVFRVEHDEFRAALRLHRFGYHSDAELQSELQWMQALGDFGILVPEVIPTKSGELFVKHSVQGMQGDVQIDLFAWIDGQQLGSIEKGFDAETDIDSMYRELGGLAARVHNQATAWQLPSGFVRHAWNADGLAGENPFWGRFWEIDSASKSETDLLVRGRDRVYEELSRLSQSNDRYSLIHADFAPENVMVEDGNVRLIDFDDAGFGWHHFELATSLYFIQDEPYFERAKDALIDGYRRHREFPDEEIEMLPLHFLARGFTYIGWVHTRHETETARELTPMLLASACELTENYLMNIN